VTKNIKSIFITLPQRGLSTEIPPFGAMAVINSLRRAGYKDTFLYNIDVLRSSREEAIDYHSSLFLIHLTGGHRFACV